MFYTEIKCFPYNYDVQFAPLMSRPFSDRLLKGIRYRHAEALYLASSAQTRRMAALQGGYLPAPFVAQSRRFSWRGAVQAEMGTHVYLVEMSCCCGRGTILLGSHRLDYQVMKSISASESD
jgi:hypothetical protein